MDEDNILETRVQSAKDYFDSYPRASKQDRLFIIFASRTEADMGLSKKELAHIVYEEEIKFEHISIDKAVQRISALISSIRKKYPTVLIFSQRILTTKNKTEWRIWYATSLEDMLEILKRLMAQREGIDNTMKRIDGERKKSQAVQSHELESYKKEIEEKIKKKKKKSEN